MENYDQNLKKIHRLAILKKQLAEVDGILKNRILKNKNYINFLQELLESSSKKLHKIISNLQQ